MRKLFVLTLTSAIAALPLHAGDAVKVYPYDHAENYCPSGLQPVTINGVICCGVPTETISYQAAKAHPVARTKRYERRQSCPAGVKGCS